MNLSAEQIYEIIKSNSDLSDQQLEEEKEKIKQKYQGLLSDVGANIMLAKQLNVSLDLKHKTSKEVVIKELNPSLDVVSLYARIKSIPAVRKFKAKDGSEGKIQAIYVFDDTGSTKLNLWHDNVNLVQQQDLKKNDLIHIKDAFVNEYNNKTELSLRQGGEIIKDPENAPAINKVQENFKLISDITSSSDKPIDTVGRIINIYPKKTFKREDRESSVLNLNISDGSKTIRVVAWSPYPEVFESDYSVGDVVYISDAIVKDGLYDLELHLNWLSSLRKNPKIDIPIPKLSEILKNEYEDTKVENLQDSKNCKIKGVVVTINRNSLVFYKCPECNTKVYNLGDDFVCENCNKAVEPVTNVFGSIEIDDSTGIVKATMFGNVVEKFFNIKKEDYSKGISDEDKEELFSYLEDQLLGKKVVVCGRAKLNDFSANLEIMVDTIEQE